MPSIFGVMLLIAGCGGLGIAALFRLEGRVRTLSAFSMLAGRLECEIGFRLTPLPELPERIPALKSFWNSMGYKPYGGESFSEAWCRAAKKLDLPPFDRALICEMGDVLGQYDADSQAKSMDTLRRQLEISLSSAREKRKAHGRLYASAGLLGGLLLAVLLV
jgi:stage III sporulation protein AB